MNGIKRDVKRMKEFIKSEARNLIMLMTKLSIM